VTVDGKSDRERSEQRVRFRALLGDYRGAVALVLVVTVLAGGYLAGTAYVAPGTTTEERVTASWERTSSFSHAATVTRPNGVFDPGQRLENRSVYFSEVTPVVDVQYTVGYTATGAGELDVNVQMRLVRLSTTTTETGQTVTLWRTERVLTNRSATDVEPGQSVTVPVSLNVTEVADRTDELVSGLGDSPGEVSVAIVADVRLDGRVNGQTTTQRFTRQVGLTAGGPTYGVTGRLQSSDRSESTTRVEREQSYGVPYRIGGPLLLGVGVVGLAGLGLAHSRGDLDVTDAERDWLAYRDARSEFDEWIHTVALPAEADDLPRARAESLGDLVDLAIDVESAVTESPDGGTFHVVHDRYHYVYEAPSPAGTGDPLDGADPTARDGEATGSDAPRGRAGDGEPGGSVQPNDDGVATSSSADGGDRTRGQVPADGPGPDGPGDDGEVDGRGGGRDAGEDGEDRDGDGGGDGGWYDLRGMRGDE
jgi:hypothetical protein